ncbi:STM3941 family protein [Mycolicibacterium fortuitum]|uniref:STM3941 family protein n=1 Tax=Mycolicibacterium fortuitum TaxID=1766 RepID=UPI001042078B|nr:STM3941 family protein [Mycolicibacterium fortuitum]
MPEFSARYSPWRLVMLTVLGVLMGAMSAWVASSAEASLLHKAVGACGTLFFLGAAVLTAVRLFDRREQLSVSPEGIYYKQWSEAVIPWDEIVGVTVWKYRRQRAIILHLADPRRFPSTTLLGRVARANRRLTGGDIAISLTPMDRSFDEAMTAIEVHRATAGR